MIIIVFFYLLICFITCFGKLCLVEFHILANAKTYNLKLTEKYIHYLSTSRQSKTVVD